jgi:Tol biopolymer transport system component
MPAPESIEITSRKDLRPATRANTSVGLVRVSPDGRRLAFHGDDGSDGGIFVSDADGSEVHRLVALGSADVDTLAWSPTGEHVAYVTGSGPPVGIERCVAWASSERDGELGRVPGLAFDWGPKKPALIVADLKQASIVRVDALGGASMVLGELRDDGALNRPPCIASAGDGQHIAFTSRLSYHDLTEVRLLTRTTEGIEASLLTQIPGAEVDVKLFWTPKSRSLAMSIIHDTVDQSGIIVVRELRGDGEVLHHHDGLDLPVAPSWSPDGKWIALFCRMAPAERRLMLLDVRRRMLLPVEASVPVGEPHFLADNLLAIDSYGVATLLELKLPDPS